jgi:hypothetical protein
MMRKITGAVACAVALLFVCGGVCFAQNWTAGAAAGDKNDKSGIVTPMTGPNGRSARVVSDSPLTGEDAALIGRCLDAIWAIPGLQGTEASVRAEEHSFRFVVYPASFTYSGGDFASMLPSGLSFYYRTSLFYDVTLKVGGYSPKVTGAYISPDGFIKNLEAAAAMPELYMYDESVLQRLDRLEAALVAVLAKSVPKSGVARETMLAIAGARNANPAITPEETVSALKDQGIKTTVKEVSAVFIVLFGME